MYANQDKVTGVDMADRQIKQKIYERYLQAFKKGVFNFIKDDNDPVTGQSIPRKYFSGGVVDLAQVTEVKHGDFAALAQADQAAVADAVGPTNIVTWQVVPDAAMLTPAVIAQRTERMKKLILFGGNWKARKDITTADQAVAKIREFVTKFNSLPTEMTKSAEIVIFPEAQWVPAIAKELSQRNILGNPIVVGVQSLFFDPTEKQKTLQRQINDAVEMGAKYANIAHSMHRLKGAGLTDAQANKIMQAILKDGRLIPWYTIEESGADVNGRSSQQEIDDAIDIGLADIPANIIATFPTTLEPTDLISTKEGTGKVDATLQVSPEDAQRRTEAVLNAFSERYGDVLLSSNVGYGASVKSSNAEGIFAVPTVKNALIGGASLEANDLYNTVFNGMKGAAVAKAARGDAAMLSPAQAAQRVEYQKHLLRFATDAVRAVAVNLTKAGFVGAARDLKGDERKAKKAATDIFAQGTVIDSADKNRTIMSIDVNEGQADEVEKSLTPYDLTVPQTIAAEKSQVSINDDNGKLFHVSSVGEKYAIAPAILDVVEGTDATADNEADKIMKDKLSGGTSIISVGERVRQIGKLPELYALQFFAYLGEHAQAFKELTETANDGKNYHLFDPELYAQNPEMFIKVVEFFQKISGKSKDHFTMEVVVMNRKTEEPLIEQLKLIQKEYPGLVINAIKAGSVAHGVDAVLSPEQYKKVTGKDRIFDAKVMLTRGGAAEAYYNLVLASQLSKTGAVGGVRLASLQMQKDGQSGEVNNQSRRYAFTSDELNQIRDLRKKDSDRIIGGEYLFNSDDLTGETVTALSAITVNGVLNLPAATNQEATVITFTNDNNGDPIIDVTRRAISPVHIAQVAKADNVQDLLKNISDVVTVTSNGVKVLDEAKLERETVYYLVNEASFGANEDIKKSAQRLLREIGIATGRKEASIHDFYMARLHGAWNNMTVPAINVRTGPTFDTMKDIFITANKADVGPVIFELAASEMRYTDQDADEYTAMVYGAAIATGYKGLLFIQADHYQTSAADYFSGKTPEEKAAAQQKAIQKVKDNIYKAILGGKRNIDVDPSTLMLETELRAVLAFERKVTTRYIESRKAVDQEFAQEIERLGGLKEKPEDESDGIWSIRRKLTDDLEIGLEIPSYKASLSAQEIKYLQEFGLSADERKEIGGLYEAAHTETKKVTKIYIEYIRELEKKLGIKTPISIGVEERHIDNPEHAKYPSTVLGSMTLMHDIIEWCQGKGYAIPSKLALQTGTMHGLGGVVDWGIYERHQLAHGEIGVAVFVQHGTSTLSPDNFAEMPKAGSGEAHLATEYQKYVFEEIGKLYPELRAKMKAYAEALMNPTATEADLDPVIVAKLKAAKLWDPAKREKDYQNKFLKRYQDAMEGLKAKGWNEDDIFAGMLADTLPKPYTGKVKDLIKELAGPFKSEIAELPENVYDSIHTRMQEEFTRIYNAQNVENTKGLLERIVPYDSIEVALPPRPGALAAAVAQVDKNNPVRIAVNGAGRIGIRLLQAQLQSMHNIQIVAMNDLAFDFKKNGIKGAEAFAKLLRRTFRNSPVSRVQDVVVESGEDEGNKYWVSVNGQKIRLTSIPDITQLPWREVGVNVAIEATGKFTSKADADKHKLAGAEKVIISAPGTGVPTIVAGVNTEMISPNDDCISGASCTTGSIAPPLKVLSRKFGIVSGTMVTTHAYTNDQSTLDGTRVGGDERGLTAATNTVFTSTGAAKAIGEVLPELKGKMDGFAYRVGIPNGSFTALSIVVNQDVTVEEVNQALKEAAESDLKGVMDAEQGPLTSQDIIGTHASSIIDLQATRVVGKRQVLLSAGYDNEFGYPNRLLDLIAAVSLNDQKPKLNDGIVKRDIPPALQAYIQAEVKRRAADHALVAQSTVDQAAIAQKDDQALKNTMDQAAISDADPLGGINLDSAMMGMQVLHDGNGMVLPVSQQPIGQFMKIKGFKPVLLNIERNVNLPARLGANFDKFPKEQLAQAASVTG